MKKVLKRSLSLLLAITIIFSSATVGLGEIDVKGIKFKTLFAIKTKAAIVDDLKFEYDSSTDSYYVSDCNDSASGSLTIPSTYNGKPVKRIGSDAFIYCINLTSITIPDSITSIENFTFEKCIGLTSITIPNSVISIGSFAFSGCTSLTSVIIPNSVTSIGYSAFKNCTSLALVTIPNSVKSIGDDAFYNCSSLNAVHITDMASWCGISFDNLYANPLYYAENLYLNSNLVTDIVIPSSVTSIGDWAFYNCTSLASIKIPDSITCIGYNTFNNTGYYNNDSNWDNGVLYIGNHLIKAKASADGDYIIKADTKTIAGGAFRNCASLTSITIPDGVIDVGCYAFYNCISLTSITIPDSVKSIGDWAFYNCTSLTSITIPNSVKSIGDYAFYNCTSLTSTTIGDSVTSIGNNAFRSCTNLASITIPDSVKSIGYYTFYNCTSLTSVTIPNSVKSIGDYAFYNCTSLTSTTIGDSVTNIGEMTFSGCTSLISITIPTSVTSIGEKAFYNTAYYNTSSNWESDILYIGNHLIKAKTSVDGDYIIKAGIKTIANLAFEDCTSLKSVTIPDSVTNIGERAFLSCGSLSSINIPDGVTDIGCFTFYNCTSLTSITIPDGVMSIGYSAFEKCTSLTSITIPDGVMSIGSSTFENCVNLTSITIPDSITSIGGWAFRYCYNLTSVTIPGSVTNIGEAAFYYCESLTSVIIPNSVKSIGDDAFYNCSSLNAVHITDMASWCGISFDNSYANPLYYAENLYLNSNLVTDIVIPSSLASIGDWAFYNCTSLTSVTIPNSVKSIGDWAFYNCTSLTSITIPDGVMSIGYSAFEKCTNLTSITIPNSVKSIGDWAFYDCNSLNSVITPCESYACTYFSSSMKLKLIHVPTGEWIVENNSTCTTAGNKYRLCSRCNGIGETAIIEPLSPETGCCFGLWHIESEPSCKTVGKQSRVCAVCGFKEVSEIPKLSHTSSEWIIDESETCTEAGSKHKECTVCGATVESTLIPATGHAPVKDNAVVATCITEGKTEGSHCSVCNEVIVAQGTIPATGHNPSDWIIDSSATAGAPGSKHRECTECCEILETVVIPQLKLETPKVATTNEINGVNVTWNAVEGAVKYNVYRRQGGSSTWTLVGTTTGTSHTDTKVTSGIYYVYSVRAYNNAGQYSDFVSANTNTRKYMAVPKLKGISNATNGLYITWNPVAGVTKGYRVYRRGAGSTYWTYLGTVKTTSYTDSQVKGKSGEYFRYTVIADGDYHSKFDTTGLYLKRLANPALNSAVSSKSGITVKWGAVKGTTGYYVYRKTANSGWVRIAAVGGTNNTTYLDKTAQKGVTYTYTVRAVYGATTSAYNSGISCYDKY